MPARPPELHPTPFSACYPTDLDTDWVDVCGYALPVELSGTAGEYHAVRNAAAGMEFSMLYKWELSGPGAVAAVDSLVSRNVTAIAPGQIAYAVMCNEDATMVEDVTITRLTRDRVRVTGAEDAINRPRFQAAANRFGATLSEHRDEYAQLSFQGPASRSILQRLTKTDLSNDALAYYRFLPDVVLDRLDVHIQRLGFTAELGYELIVPVEQASALWNLLADAGEPHGVLLAGAGTVMTARVEAGMVMAHVEYDETMTPYECRLGWTVDLAKADFLGRDALAAARATARRRVVSVVVDDVDESKIDEAPLLLDGKRVGHVTMAVQSPHLGGRTLGMARVERAAATVGTQLAVEIDGRQLTAAVVATPVYDPGRVRAHG